MRAVYVGTCSNHGVATLFRCQHFKTSKQQYIQNMKRQFKNSQQFFLRYLFLCVYCSTQQKANLRSEVGEVQALANESHDSECLCCTIAVTKRRSKRNQMYKNVNRIELRRFRHLEQRIQGSSPVTAHKGQPYRVALNRSTGALSVPSRPLQIRRLH